MWFFKWLYNAVVKASEWIVSIPGMVATFIGTVITTLTQAFGFFTSHSSQVTSAVNSAQAYVSSISGNLQGNTVFSTLSYMFSLDIAWNYIYSIGGLFLGIFGFLFVELVEALLLLLAAVMVFKTTRWIASLITLGVSKF